MQSNQKIKYDFITRSDLIEKLQKYQTNPDDDAIPIKKRIEEIFIRSPELLYALHASELEKELFNKDGSLNVDEDGNPLGEWDKYFGENSYIRPFLYIPQTQEDVKHFICYEVSFTQTPKYNDKEKYCLITFVILVNGKDAIDKETGIPRHDLIGSIIREKISWSGLIGAHAVPTSDKGTITDNNYIMRTMVFESLVPNSIVKTEKRADGSDFTYYSNKVKP